MTSERDTLVRLRGMLDDAAAADIAELVQEARLEARTKVRAILAEAMVERMLRLAEDEPTSAERRRQPTHDNERAVATPRPEPAPARRAPRPAERAPADAGAGPPTDLGCYVYGVVGADAQPSDVTDPHDPDAVFLVHGESSAAVASFVPLDEFGQEALEDRLEDLSWLEPQARRHEQVLQRVREQATVVPMRLCTIYSDEQSVRDMLDRESAFLRDALERLRERTEWGVKIYALGEPLDTPDAADGAGDNGASAGASYLQDKRLQARRRRQAHELIGRSCERAHGALSQAAVQAKVNPVQPRELTNREEQMVFNGAYLVDDGAAEAFAQLVHGLQADVAPDGLQLELTGPWPAYNFAGRPREIAR
jgi:acetolactate synthase small subunit